MVKQKSILKRIVYIRTMYVRLSRQLVCLLRLPNCPDSVISRITAGTAHRQYARKIEPVNVMRLRE